MVFEVTRRRSHWSVALLFTAVAWSGADHRLTARPETIATFFVVAAVWLVTSEVTWRRVALYAVLTAVWINVHPSALLSPILAGVGLIDHGQVRKRAAVAAGAAIALLMNPHFVEGVVAPLRLMRTIGQGSFVNLEWLPSSPGRFPLLYLTVILGVVFFLFRFARAGQGPAGQPPALLSFLLFAFLAYLAIRHVRNQGFFFASAPLLLAPLALRELKPALARALVVAAGLVGVVVAYAHLPWRIGIDEQLFPVSAVARLKETGVQGTIYTPDQLGGFVIWSFYPERRAITDGRNELFTTYLDEYRRARVDSRAWTLLLEKYQVRSAIEEYRSEPVEIMDARSGNRRRIPASLVFFPRDQWALVGYDAVAMTLVRRDAIAPERLGAMELKGVVPDAPGETGSQASEPR